MLASKAGKVLQFTIFFAFGIFLIWYTTRSFTKEEVQQVKELMLNAKLGIIIPCMFILILSHWIRALRWKLLIEPLGFSPKSLNIFLSVILGFFFNLLFPRLGEVMKCSLLGKHEKIPVDKLIGTMVAERLFDLCCLIIVIFLTIYTQFDIVGNYTNELLGLLKKKVPDLTGKLFYLFLGCLLAVFLIYLLYKKIKNWHLYDKIISFLKGISHGLMSFRLIKNKTKFIIYTLSIWFLYFYSIKFGFLALSELEQLGWIPGLTILTFGSFAMIATQGGIGAYQLAVQKTLTLYNINEVDGLAFGWLLWSVQTILLLIFGPLSWIFMTVLNKKKNHPEI